MISTLRRRRSAVAVDARTDEGCRPALDAVPLDGRVRVVVADDVPPRAAASAGRVRPRPLDPVVLDVAVRVVAAENADAEAAADDVVLDRAHGHLCHRDAAQARARDAIVLELDVGAVRDDALGAAVDAAAAHAAPGLVDAEGDLDPLPGRPCRDGAVADVHRAEPRADPVHARASHDDAVERHVVAPAHLD